MGVSVHVVVMGVSGTGKSTVAALLAEQLGVDLIEGDAFHPAQSLAKMAAGLPLTDEDRQPWLAVLAGLTAGQHGLGRSTVLTCSALRRRYRDLLRGTLTGMFFVHLVADHDVLEVRMRNREHFMPASLLQSQLATLEPLEEDEHGITLDAGMPVEDVVAEAGRAIEAFREVRLSSGAPCGDGERPGSSNR